MIVISSEKPEQFYARFAGLLYLVIIFCGISSELFIRSNLIVSGDANLTAANILASQGLFRFGFVLDSIMLLSDVAIAVLFFLLFRPVNQSLALTAMVFRLAQAAILAFNLLNYYAANLVLNMGSGAIGLNAAQSNELALLFLNIHAYGYDLGLLFFAVSNLILGYLIIQSALVPKWIGWGLLAAAVVYLIGSYVRFLFPEQYRLLETLYIIPFVVELSFCLYLLIKGVKHQPELTART